MTRLRFTAFLGLVFASCLASSAHAVTPTYVTSTTGTLSPFQTTTIPMGYSFASKTYLAGSDTTSAAFQTLVPTYLSYITAHLQEGVAFTGEGLNQLDPTRLFFYFTYTPRCYFIYGYAATTNGFGVTIATVDTPTSSPVTGTNLTCMSDVDWNGATTRSASYPVLPGDYVQLPTVQAGQQLAFFCEAHEDSNGNPAYLLYNGTAMNPDGKQHMIAFFPDNSQYIIIGFENAIGGDNDCNDVMFVVDVGPNNAAAMRSPTVLGH